MNESCHTYEWVMSHILMSRVPQYEWVMWHIWFINQVNCPSKDLSHVTHMNESCHTYEWVMSHIWMSHVTHMNASCHTYEWVIKESFATHERVVSHTHTATSRFRIVGVHGGSIHRRICGSVVHVCSVSHAWMHHVTHTQDIFHMWKMSHVTHTWVICHA